MPPPSNCRLSSLHGRNYSSEAARAAWLAARRGNVASGSCLCRAALKTSREMLYCRRARGIVSNYVLPEASCLRRVRYRCRRATAIGENRQQAIASPPLSSHPQSALSKRIGNMRGDSYEREPRISKLFNGAIEIKACCNSL